MAKHHDEIKAIAKEHYGGDLHKAACHHIYGKSVIDAGGGKIPSGMDMTQIDKAVSEIKKAPAKKKAAAPRKKAVRPDAKKAPAKRKR